jgi:hypothetical protein
MFTKEQIRFFEKSKTEEQIQSVKKQYAKSTFMLRPPISNVESSDPRIRRMVAGLLELGFDTMDIQV